MSAIKGQLEEENGRDIVDELAGSAAHSIAVLSEVEAALTLRARRLMHRSKKQGLLDYLIGMAQHVGYGQSKLPWRENRQNTALLSSSLSSRCRPT